MQHTILIAEDDHDLIELLTLYLTGADFAVRAVTDGEQALEAIRGLDPQAKGNVRRRRDFARAGRSDDAGDERL